jgi:uncharacterized membrane protein
MSGGSALVSRDAHQRRSRALVKAGLYRLCMILVSVGVAWAIVGDATAAVSIGLATNVVKTGTYYVYERLWAHVSWGIEASAGR